MNEPAQSDVAFLVFDIETIADGDLIGRVRYPEDHLQPHEAVARYRDELRNRTGSDFIPPTFCVPVAICVAKVDQECRLLDVSVIDEPDFRPATLTKGFWQGWRHYERPVLVTFNGRGFDLPVLELAAFRYGIALPDWFQVDERSFQQARHRYNLDAHIDLMDLLSNFGATKITGGLNLLSHMIGKPGKTGIDGSQVQRLYDAGKVEDINDYCRCDVLDTYFVFLRSRVLLGKLSLEEEQSRVEEAKTWIESHAKDRPAYQHYLDHWGKWEQPRFK